MQTFRALLRLHVQGGSPTRWSYQADFMLLVRLWRNQLQGATTTPHVPGRSRPQCKNEHVFCVNSGATRLSKMACAWSVESPLVLLGTSLYCAQRSSTWT